MKYAAQMILCLAFLTGCRASGIGGYWNNCPLLDNNLSISEERFADFAELAVAAPQADALFAIDALFDRLKQDTVAYYIYSEWMDGAFYNLLSPCRNATLYTRAVDRIVTDAVLSTAECDPFLKKRQWIGYNQPGERAVVPGYPSFTDRTLALVLDLSCSSCRQALEKLSSDPQWAGIRHLAVCCGDGSYPVIPGWDYIFPENPSAVFDPDLTPIFFIVAADGTVESGYSLAL